VVLDLPQIDLACWEIKSYDRITTVHNSISPYRSVARSIDGFLRSQQPRDEDTLNLIPLDTTLGPPASRRRRETHKDTEIHWGGGGREP
jgi:hypothetical protein